MTPDIRYLRRSVNISSRHLVEGACSYSLNAWYERQSSGTYPCRNILPVSQKTRWRVSYLVYVMVQISPLPSKDLHLKNESIRQCQTPCHWPFRPLFRTSKSKTWNNSSGIDGPLAVTAEVFSRCRWGVEQRWSMQKLRHQLQPL